MKSPSSERPGVNRIAARLLFLALPMALLIGACSMASTSSPTISATPMPMLPTTPPNPDPRVGLSPGEVDDSVRIVTEAAEAAWNMRLVSNTPPAEPFRGVTSSDLAFKGDYVFQGNYNGFQVWDMSTPETPSLELVYLCPASQSDVSVYQNLLFVSGEGQGGRVDCGAEGVPEPVSPDRLRGIRIFDISDVTNPVYMANVQTCRGSHTHTVVSDPNDDENVYIYVSGSSRVRDPEELAGCIDAPIDDPNSARFRLEVIQVPLDNPEAAAIVTSPRIFNDLLAPPRRTNPNTAGRGGGGGGRGGGRGAGGGPSQCHDITTYPAMGLAGGACGGYGLLLDISEVTNPRRLYAAADSNMSFWHSATFSNDGTKVLFTDEWGGGSAPRCRVTDRYEWGANALFTIEDNELVFHSYYKMPAAQTESENCVAHNGSLIPIPGREVMVQGWYQGGISVFDWTDVANPQEIAFHDRGPLTTESRVTAGSWSVYWYNGYMVSSEIQRGLDIFELTPSGWLSQNEIDAAKTVRFEFLNAQEQPYMEWPPSFVLSAAYLDQLVRSGGLSSARIQEVRTELVRAEGLSGQSRRQALTALASELDGDAQGSSDADKVRTLAASMRDLAGA